MIENKITALTRVRFVYYDNDGNEYYVIERDMNTVPNVGEEIFLDTGDFGIDPDGWTIESRVCDLYMNRWELAIKHRNDHDGKINRFKDRIKKRND
jgi:hypothetical protein